MSLDATHASFRFSIACLVLALPSCHMAADGVVAPPWMNRAWSPDQRARAAVAAMTLNEKIGLTQTRYGVPMNGRSKPVGALDSAGFNPGVPRLGLPPLQETNAGLGVADPTEAAFEATAMPSGLALGASFDPSLAMAAGAVVGAEARAMGFGVLLGGGANLIRDPRSGRNIEYVGEDPLLTGTIAGADIAGAQGNGIVSTLKHYALNDQENGRVGLDAVLGKGAAREADLFAFELALERGRPGAVMTGYNRINGAYASENGWLITDVLKGDWGFGGWVMSDWMATHSTEPAALAGLDQASGDDNNPRLFFGPPLKAAVEAGRVPMARLDDMVRRLLRAQFAAGLIDRRPRAGAPIDFGAHAAVAERVAAAGIVLLKNAAPSRSAIAILPLDPHVKRVLVVGGHADVGVLSGGGSSQVVPRGAIRFPGEPPEKFPDSEPKLYDPSSPLAALRRALPDAAITFIDGHDVSAAATAAAMADVVVVFADAWSTESLDAASLALPNGQDALVGAVAVANPRTVVVLETGRPVLMPWLDAVPGVLEAWYPGARGGDAIADVLTGSTNPSGHLPVTFPASEAQLPRPTPTNPDVTENYPGDTVKGPQITIDYDIEGADVGYRWFLRTGRTPLFPFGHGLSYTSFATGNLAVTPRAGALTVDFKVSNRGARAGIDTPQVYLQGDGLTRRLVAFDRVDLRPASRVADPRPALDGPLRRNRAWLAHRRRTVRSDGAPECDRRWPRRRGGPAGPRLVGPTLSPALSPVPG